MGTRLEYGHYRKQDYKVIHMDIFLTKNVLLRFRRLLSTLWSRMAYFHDLCAFLGFKILGSLL